MRGQIIPCAAFEANQSSKSSRSAAGAAGSLFGVRRGDSGNATASLGAILRMSRRLLVVASPPLVPRTTAGLNGLRLKPERCFCFRTTWWAAFVLISCERQNAAHPFVRKSSLRELGRMAGVAKNKGK